VFAIVLKLNKGRIAGMPAKMEATTETRKPTLLCIDDNQSALHVRKLVLESAGYRVLVASDSATAMEIFSSSTVDIVVSDHFLQDCTGIELATAMKKLKPDVPIVIISGLVDAPEGMEHADLFISKADSPPEVLQKIAELLNSRS
jgi:CheY-like chemotaxis protein